MTDKEIAKSKRDHLFDSWDYRMLVREGTPSRLSWCQPASGRRWCVDYTTGWLVQYDGTKRRPRR